MPVASYSGQPGHYTLCSFALNSLGQAAYMLNRRESSTVVWTEAWFFDGNASQLVYSALSSAATRPRCNPLTGDVPSNVGLRDDGLVSFELYVPAGGTALAYGRPGVGIQGTIPDPLSNSNLSANINAYGRVGFGRLSGGTGSTVGTADANGIVASVALSSGYGGVGSSLRAPAVNDLDQVAYFFRDTDAEDDPVMLAFFDPNGPAGSQYRAKRLGTDPEVVPRPTQPSMNNKRVVAFASTQPNGTGQQRARARALDPVGGAGLLTVADTTSGRFADFAGFASINVFNRVAFLSSVSNAGIATSPVLARSAVSISRTANGITKSRVLTVTPAATASPTSLKFGSVPVGQPGAPLVATLSNKGAVPFSVTGISLTGTSASWDAQANDCGGSLAPGASCTISVTFTPLAAASKSAKLAIATSATSAPLSVSLSGTGTL